MIKKILLSLNQDIIMQIALMISLWSVISLFRVRIVKFLMKKVAYKLSDLSNLIKYPTVNLVRSVFSPSVFIVCCLCFSFVLNFLKIDHKLVDGTITLMLVYVILKTIAVFSGKDKSNSVIYLILLFLFTQQVGLGKKLEKALKSIHINIVDIKISLHHIAYAVFMIVVLYWFVSVVLSFGNKLIRTRSRATDSNTKELEYKVFSYLVYSISIIISLTIIGVQSSHIALIGSAVGIGLGFGLQKIVANFISGIILMVEQSVKIGDILELEGGQIGTVKKIGVRAITITTFDGKDWIVPNDNLTTKETINYTLSDNKIRLSANFYLVKKEDIKVALELMRRACLMEKGVSREKRIICCARDVTERGVHLMSLFWINNFAQDDILRIKSSIISVTLDLMTEYGIELYFERSLGILRDTLNRVSEVSEISDTPFVNRFGGAPMSIATSDTKEKSPNIKKFSE